MAGRRRLEVGLALVLVGASSVHLLRFVRQALRLSLWNDEIFSVVISSSQGPATVVTEYQSNNHVFFNLLNALTPGADSMDPARARAWSIVAVVAMLAAGTLALWRRGWFLVGAVFFALFAANPGWLDLALQARGYGLLGLAATVTCLGVWRHLERGGRGSLVALGLATVLGTWTLPSFLLFVAPLWLALLVATRSRAVLVGGVLSAAATAAVHLPIIGQVWDEAARYEELYGRSYTGLKAVADTFRTYLLDATVVPLGRLPVLVAASLPLMLVGVALVVPFSTVTRRLVLVLNASVVVFLAANVAMGTAVVRTTAFAVVPVVFSAAVAAGETVDRARPHLPRWGRTAALVAAAVAVAVAAVGVVGPLDAAHYLPIQDWAGASRHVARTFPDGTGLAATRDWLGVLRGSHLPDGYPADGDPATAVGLASGRSLLFDSSTSDPPAFDFSAVAPVWSEARFAQRQGRYLRVLAAPPMHARVGAVRVDGRELDRLVLTDRLPTAVEVPTGTAVSVVPGSSAALRSLVLVGSAPLPPVAEVVVATGSGRQVLPASDLLRSGTTLTVYLGDRPVGAVEITFRHGDPPVELAEVWAYPPALQPADR